MVNISKRRAELESRLAVLDERLHKIDDELDSHNAKDWEEMATEREEEEVLEGMGVSGQVEMRMIKAALQRMDQDEYGFCVECGDGILTERLDVLPYTPFYSTCAAKHA